MMTGCTFLMLDEPSMGLAPVLKYELFRTLKRLNEQGMTILLVEQNAKLALELAPPRLRARHRQHRRPGDGQPTARQPRRSRRPTSGG